MRQHMLMIRHSTRNPSTGILTKEGNELIDRVAAPFQSTHKTICSSTAKHCIETATHFWGSKSQQIVQWEGLDAFVPFHDELKKEAFAMGIDHGQLWFERTPQDEVLKLIQTPGESYYTSVIQLCKGLPYAENLVAIGRGTGLEGLARILDPNYSPFNGWFFNSCEGMLLEVVEKKEVKLCSYIRTR